MLCCCADEDPHAQEIRNDIAAIGEDEDGDDPPYVVHPMQVHPRSLSREAPSLAPRLVPLMASLSCESRMTKKLLMKSMALEFCRRAGRSGPPRPPSITAQT